MYVIKRLTLLRIKIDTKVYNSSNYALFTLSDCENDICSETDEMAKSSQWHQWQGFRAVRSALHITVEPIIIVVSLGIVLDVIQCEQTIKLK